MLHRSPYLVRHLFLRHGNLSPPVLTRCRSQGSITLQCQSRHPEPCPLLRYLGSRTRVPLRPTFPAPTLSERTCMAPASTSLPPLSTTPPLSSSLTPSSPSSLPSRCAPDSTLSSSTPPTAASPGQSSSQPLEDSPSDGAPSTHRASQPSVLSRHPTITRSMDGTRRPKLFLCTRNPLPSAHLSHVADDAHR